MKSLRANIWKIAILLTALFILLIAYGAYSLTTYGSRWFSTSANTYLRSAKQNVIPGDVQDVNGVTLLTANVAEDENGETTWSRVWPADQTLRQSVVHVLGDSQNNVSNGVEAFMANYLYGFEATFPERLGSFLSGQTRRGDSLTLTIDSALCRQITEWIAQDEALPDDVRGAVVVMNWQTGAVLAEMSFPSFDPLSSRSYRNDAGQPYFNRAIQGKYAPGSTFKIVTAAGILASPELRSQSFTCSGILRMDASGAHDITDAGTRLAEGQVVSHGQLDLQTAFRVSCNNAFAYAAWQLGDEQLKKTAQAFGFDDNFLFRDIVLENSAYPGADRSDWEIAMTGIGQSGLLLTPMHLCLIASAIANNGVMMEPRLLERAETAAGAERLHFTSAVYRTPLTDPDTIHSLRSYMYDVVNTAGGTGRAASLIGWRVCGKTGSAEIDGQENTNAWFTGFIDSEKAPYSVAILLEDVGGGGTYAAPLAQKIFKYLTAQVK
ncbi:MAG: hypothetical protein IJ240_10980 [Clostridia bacterium]|nr:hypothetical protein [Clostridia bacterium]